MLWKIHGNTIFLTLWTCSPSFLRLWRHGRASSDVRRTRLWLLLLFLFIIRDWQVCHCDKAGACTKESDQRGPRVALAASNGKGVIECCEGPGPFLTTADDFRSESDLASWHKSHVAFHNQAPTGLYIWQCFICFMSHKARAAEKLTPRVPGGTWQFNHLASYIMFIFFLYSLKLGFLISYFRNSSDSYFFQKINLFSIHGKLQGHCVSNLVSQYERSQGPTCGACISSSSSSSSSEGGKSAGATKPVPP